MSLADKLNKRLDAINNGGQKIPVSQQKKKSLAEKLANVPATKTLSQEVEELVQQINLRGYDRIEKINNNLFTTDMPAITYDLVIAILNNRLKIYEDVLEGDLPLFESLIEFENEWRRTKDYQKGSEFLFRLRTLQSKYNSTYEEEPALHYLQDLAKGEKHG